MMGNVRCCGVIACLFEIAKDTAYGSVRISMRDRRQSQKTKYRNNKKILGYDLICAEIAQKV